MKKTAELSGSVVIAVMVGGCAASFREQVTIASPTAPEMVPWRLNRELLMPVNRRIEFLVEQMAGHPPEREALNDLVRIAERYGGRPAGWRRHAEGQPIALEPDATYVFVKYVGNQLPGFGQAYARHIRGRTIYFIIVNQEAHRLFRAVAPEHRLEQQTLIHEYGHLLGLPTTDHGYYANFPDLAGGRHCVNPDCALSLPRWRALLYNAFHIAFAREYLDDYCDECRRTIEAAQQHWLKTKSNLRSEKVRNEVGSLPPPRVVP